MIDLHRLLMTILGELPLRDDAAGVVGENVDARVFREERVSK